MTSMTYKKIIFKLSLVGLVLVIFTTFGDVIIGSIFEGLHILFEVIEVILDNLVEHIFDTNVHQTQTIVFYIMIAGAIGIVYTLSHAIAKFFHNMVDASLEYKTNATLYWQDTSLIRKIIYCVCLLTVLVLGLMFAGYM
jgi:hypothetical protein